jgi:hypothetical protein
VPALTERRASVLAGTVGAVERVLRPAAVVGAAAWAVAVSLVATQAVDDPVAGRYDEANRLVSVALLPLAIAAWAFRRQLGDRLPRVPLGATTWAIGLTLMLAGSAVEFWGAWIAGEQGAAEADRAGREAWQGAGFGFALFAMGAFVAAGGALAAGIRLAPLVGRTIGLAVPAAGLAMVAGTLLWSTSVAVALVAGVSAAMAWLAIAWAGGHV